MRFIDEIVRVEDKGEYTITHILTDGDEAQGYLPKADPKFEVGERIEVFFHDEWNQAKFRRLHGRARVDRNVS